eukprot:SAG31_NODE_38705_length_294_cov_0.687179_1_plen_41_part_10
MAVKSTAVMHNIPYDWRTAVQCCGLGTDRQSPSDHKSTREL